jgi:hypothetical protein
MEALAERLAQLDTQAEGALRVVLFYDTLLRRRVDLPALARASAGPAECRTLGHRADHDAHDRRWRRCSCCSPST